MASEAGRRHSRCRGRRNKKGRTSMDARMNCTGVLLATMAFFLLSSFAAVARAG